MSTSFRRPCVGLRSWLSFIVSAASLLGAASREVVAEAPAFSEPQLTFFETRIRPVLVEHCYECHAAGAKIIQGGLELDHRAGLLRGGDSGAAIVPGNTEQSLLLKALRHETFEMPPRGKLPETIIQDFTTWIAMGAPDPRPDPKTRTSSRVDREQGRQHWAFQPVVDPALPSVAEVTWSIDALDRFILAKLEAAGLKPNSDADRYTWLRRVSLDLTGLPATPSEIDAFLQDDSPHAYETVVDRLLHSRAYGERWARHWLDLTGYADMMGTSNNVFAEHAWRYRDYLIEAFRGDKPFDRFVREQIAGDLLAAECPEERAENLTATGFLMVGDVEIVEPDKAKMEADHIDSQVSKIGMVFLGMTLGCVRCHDHKFDPLDLSDYYGIAGMLRSSPATHKIPFGVWSLLNSTELPETPDQQSVRQQREAEHEARLVTMKAERERLQAEQKMVNDELTRLTQLERLPGRRNDMDASEVRTVGLADQAVDAVSPVVSVGKNALQATQQQASSSSAKGATQVESGSSRTSFVAVMTNGAVADSNEKRNQLTQRRDELTAQLKRLATRIQHAEFFRSQVPKAFAMQDGAQPSDMPILIRGNPYAPGRVIPRGAVQVISWESFPEIPAGQSGRLQLADWLVDKRNPLTARVLVNRVWQKLFGEGLVASIDYFGSRGATPSHPELLDHLAMRFMRQGWSQKQLIRSLVLSRTYRQSSINNANGLQVDPDNRLLWRMHRQRLDAEAIRDSLLAVSGQLLATSGGPALVLEEVENCGALVQRGVNPPNYTHRKPRPIQAVQRTIYLPVMRTNTNREDRIRTHFDFINPAQIAGQRPQTVVPTQALFVLNNELFRQHAQKLAERLLVDEPVVETRLEQLWLRVWNRPISVEERADANAFLNDLQTPRAAEQESDRLFLAWHELCHSLLASNEFIFRF
jgi:hypothetical protein